MLRVFYLSVVFVWGWFGEVGSLGFVGAADVDVIRILGSSGLSEFIRRGRFSIVYRRFS